MIELGDLRYVDIPAAVYSLGWRFDDTISGEARQSMEAFLPWDELLKRFSPRRTVDLPSFSIATTTIAAEDLLSDIDDDDDGHLESLAALCSALNLALGRHGLRLPSEDEVEAACSGGMFPWGDQIPDGVPYGDETSFTAHLAPNQYGLALNATRIASRSPRRRSSSGTAEKQCAAAIRGQSSGCPSARATA